MREKILSLFLLIGAVAGAFGQSTIVHVNGPELGFARELESPPSVLDLDADGISDFSFVSSSWICTQDIPTSACSAGYYVGVSPTSELLASGYAQVLPFGEWIGSNAPTGATWNGSGNGAALTYFHWRRSGENSWDGPLGIQGIGYLGVRFHAADGLHYGWIRVRLDGAPIVMEWAYETRPNTPIAAGATGSESGAVEFTVVFRRPDDTEPTSGGYASTATLQLIGNVLRYELHVAGTYESARLRGPAVPHSNAQPAVSLDSPRIAVHNSCRLFYDSATGRYVERCGPDFAVFFGEVTLSHSQVIQLKRGALHLSIDDGAVIGRVVPTPTPRLRGQR